MSLLKQLFHKFFRPKKKVRLLFVFLVSVFACRNLQGESSLKLRTIYNRLDPSSLSQHLAFYHLYNHTPLGDEVLQHLHILLAASPPFYSAPSLEIFTQFLNKSTSTPLPIPSLEQLEKIDSFIPTLCHKKLLGHSIWTEQELLDLPPDQIDLARGLFVSQFEKEKEKILAYEMLLDLMALQILNRLPSEASSEQKIEAMNTFIFEELRFRFPPHSLHCQEIDRYTFLPPVLDSHRGVCLGVSTLYLCLGQRIGLSLEAITPPGHIYVRHCQGDKKINIETTARGIHVDCEHYLGIKNHRLKVRTLREVIGMTYVNQASMYLQNLSFAKAVETYKKAQPYLKEDPFIKELLGYCLIACEKKEEGEKLLNEVKDIVPDDAIIKENILEDYLAGKVDIEGIKILFKKTGEERKDILEKKEALEKILKKWPHFRSGIASLASTWLELHRSREALSVINRYLQIDDNEPEIHYYAGVIQMERNNYPQAWIHLKKAEALLEKKNHRPKVLKEFKRKLLFLYTPSS